MAPPLAPRANRPAPVMEPRVEPVVDTLEDTDEPDVAHITRRDDSLRGYIEGTPVEALCGVKFVPSRNPDGMPVCEPCKQVMERIIAARSGNN